MIVVVFWLKINVDWRQLSDCSGDNELLVRDFLVRFIYY